MKQKQNDYGGGSTTNATGLTFEQAVSDFMWKEVSATEYLINDITKPATKSKTHPKLWEVKDSNGNIIAMIGFKSAIFKWLDIRSNFENYWNEYIPSKTLKQVWSKNLDPDILIVKLGEETKFHIIEVKYQNDSGSVDEKLQTGPFKREMWRKLFTKLIEDETKITYTYLVSNWFNRESSKDKEIDKKYKNVFDYLSKQSIDLFINETKDWEVDHAKKQQKIDDKVKTIKNEYYKYLPNKPDFKLHDGKPFDIKKYLS